MGHKLPLFLTVSILLNLPFFLLNCSNPVDEEPLRWKTVMEIPVTNRSFIIAEEMDNLFDIDSMDILYATSRYKEDDISLLEPDSLIGDTLEFSIFKRDSSKFKISEEKLKNQVYVATLGPLVISNAPQIAETLVVSSEGPFNVTLPVIFEKIYQLVFYDTSVNIMQIQFTNLSSDEVSSVSLEIVDVGVGSVEKINAGETASIRIPVSSKTLRNPVQFKVSGVKNGAGAMQIAMATSVNGLYAYRLTVDDHLVSFNKQFSNPYEITDSIDIDYVDIRDGFFIYEVTNHTGIELRVKGIHEHLWKTSFTERNSYNRYEDLLNVSKTDSMENYFGFITSGEVIAPPRLEQTFSQENFSQSRLYTQWDPVLRKTVTWVRYIVSTGNPSGDTITLCADDTLTFTIRSDFKYRQLRGRIVKPMVITSDTEKVAINFPWGESAPDSLRGKLILQNVYSDIRLRTEMSPNSAIDSVYFSFEVFDIRNPDVKDSLMDKFIGMKDGSLFRQKIDITDVVNLYPDTVAIITRLTVPTGTMIISENDLQLRDPEYDKYIGQMNIDAITDFRLNARFDWEVKEMVNLDLGGNDFPIYKIMRYIRKLDKKQLDFETEMLNSSNLNMTLFALVAPYHLRDTLDSMSSDEVFYLATHEGEAEKRGMVNFLGSKGVSIPAKSLDSAVVNVVHWNHQQLETVLSSDTCSWRWFLQFQKNDRDALRDNDFIRINSMLRIEGINSTDSLVMW